MIVPTPEHFRAAAAALRHICDTPEGAGVIDYLRTLIATIEKTPSQEDLDSAFLVVMDIDGLELAPFMFELENSRGFRAAHSGAVMTVLHSKTVDGMSSVLASVIGRAMLIGILAERSRARRLN